MEIRGGIYVAYRRVLHPGRPDWGPGTALAEDGTGRVTVFFVAGGRRRIDARFVPLRHLSGLAAQHPLLDLAEQVDWSRAHHNVYVVELSPEVFEVQAFQELNPGTGGTRQAVYVGLTGLSPEERFENHRQGHKSSRYVKMYGLHLRPDLYRDFNPLPYDLAALMEPELARQLRERGFGVWQN